VLTARIKGITMTISSVGITLFARGVEQPADGVCFSRKQMAQFENGYRKAECALRRVHPTAFGNVVRLRKSVLPARVGRRIEIGRRRRSTRNAGGPHKDAEYTLSKPSNA